MGQPCKQDAKWPSGLHPQTQLSCMSGQEASLAHLCSGIDILPTEDTIAEGSGGVVIDELQYFKASHSGSLQHSSTLSLVEEGWHGDDGILDGLLCRGRQNRVPPAPYLR